MRTTLATTLTALLLLTASTSLIADVAPKLMNYQALVTDDQGDPLEGTYTITFTIYGSQTGSDILWQETHSRTISAGQLNVVLGEGDVPTPVDESVFATQETWLGITVAGDPELTPRTRLVTVPYSQRVNTVDLAKGGAISGAIEVNAPSVKTGQALEASVMVRGSAGDSVFMSPSDDIALYATNDAGDVAFAATADEQGGSLQILANASTTLASSPRYVMIQPASNIAFQATGDNGDNLIMMTTAPEGGAIEVNASNQLKDPDAITRSVQIAPADNVVLQSTEELGDITFSMTSGPTGGEFRVSSTDAAKALTRNITISPTDNRALRATDGNGNVLLEAVAAPGMTGILINEVSKDGRASTPRVQINSTGLSFFASNGVDTAFNVDNSGNLYTRGNVIAGQPLAKDGRAYGAWSTVLGFSNTADGDSAVVSGGFANQAVSKNATVAGGVHNVAGATGKAVLYGYETVGGGSNNLASGRWSSVAGGGNNQSTDEYACVTGGFNNTASGVNSSVLGGQSNQATGTSSTIAGGYACQATAAYAAVIGGNANTAAQGNDIVAGGNTNTASGGNSGIIAGVLNQASGPYSMITGGQFNKARGQFSIVCGGGGWSDSDSNEARGHYSIVAGGRANRAVSNYTFVAGRQAIANHEGAYIWADANAFDFNSTANNEFAARSTGGARFVTAIDGSGTATAGVTLAAGGGSWSSLCDVNSKENFEKVDLRSLLEKLSAVEISTWNYRAQDENIRHIGPMAQDFYAAFGVGEDERRITSIDADGIALAAIQALNAELTEKTEQLAEQGKEIDELKAQLAGMRELIEKLISENETSR